MHVQKQRKTKIELEIKINYNIYKRTHRKSNYSKVNNFYQIFDTVGYRTPDMRRWCGCHKHPLPHPILNGDTGQENFHFPGTGHLSARQLLWHVHATDSWKTLGPAN